MTTSDQDTKQLADWLLIDPETGSRLTFAGPLEPDFLRMSRVKMVNAEGDVWTLTAGLKEGYLTQAERLANIKRCYEVEKAEVEALEGKPLGYIEASELSKLQDVAFSETTESHVRLWHSANPPSRALIPVFAAPTPVANSSDVNALPENAALVPTLYQYRIKPTWHDGPWSDWKECRAAAAADYRRVPLLHDWEYEVRELFEHPAPTPVADSGARESMREATREMIAANPEGARLEMVHMAREIRELRAAAKPVSVDEQQAGESNHE